MNTSQKVAFSYLSSLSSILPTSKKDTINETECGKEPYELILHFVKYHDQLSKVLGPLKHDNRDHTRLNDDGGGNQLEVELTLSGVSHGKYLTVYSYMNLQEKYRRSLFHTKTKLNC